MRRIFIPATSLVFLILVFILSFSIASAKEGDKNPAKADSEYVGAETCQGCHSKVYDQLAKTAMGTLFLKHPRTAAEKLGCETCHGSGTEHVSSGGKSFEGMIRYTKGTTTPVSVQNESCLKCHQKRNRLFWQNSMHAVQGLACTSCHAVHTGPGAANRNQLTRITVNETCATCHKAQVRAENKFSHHPLREGKMNCASCHNPHGTTAPKLIKAFSNKELCFNCHAQYRGPFIWQHPPVMEDCFNCHQPHGSNYPALLKTPPIRLCRECHITFHTTNFGIATPGVPGNVKTRINMTAGNACVNCHRNIHGSNSVNGQLFFR
jgi:DmsE family decaheme c-type cytochrome